MRMPLCSTERFEGLASCFVIWHSLPSSKLLQCRELLQSFQAQGLLKSSSQGKKQATSLTPEAIAVARAGLKETLGLDAGGPDSCVAQTDPGPHRHSRRSGHGSTRRALSLGGTGATVAPPEPPTKRQKVASMPPAALTANTDSSHGTESSSGGCNNAGIERPPAPGVRTKGAKVWLLHGARRVGSGKVISDIGKPVHFKVDPDKLGVLVESVITEFRGVKVDTGVDGWRDLGDSIHYVIAWPAVDTEEKQHS